jgi:histidinol-phosphate aminotransferase
LAGLRIGILVGEAGHMAMVRRVASPYNVNAVALAILPEALRDQEYV